MRVLENRDKRQMTASCQAVKLDIEVLCRNSFAEVRWGFGALHEIHELPKRIDLR